MCLIFEHNQSLDNSDYISQISASCRILAALEAHCTYVNIYEYALFLHKKLRVARILRLQSDYIHIFIERRHIVRSFMT
ncbi:hypothetical protein DSUL_20316 [Desulfovibrionales bacterium]